MEDCVIIITYYFIIKEHNQKRYAWYDLEDAYEDCYMGNCNFWEDNYFHLFYDSTHAYKDKLVEKRQQQLVPINFQYIS